jgi:hypothetical protein
MSSDGVNTYIIADLNVKTHIPRDKFGMSSLKLTFPNYGIDSLTVLLNNCVEITEESSEKVGVGVPTFFLLEALLSLLFQLFYLFLFDFVTPLFGQSLLLLLWA